MSINNYIFRSGPLRFATAILAAGALVAFSPTGLAEHELRTPARAEGPALTVVTINMAGEANPDRILGEWRQHPDIWNADVITMQEVVHFAGEKPSIAQLLAKEMGRYVVSEPNLRHKNTDGLAILSRYPLVDFEAKQLNHYDLVFRTRTRIMIAVTVESPLGPVRVFNTHLDTRINTDERLQQLSPVIAEAARWNGPRLIAGDFNTNYFRWVRNVMPLGISFQGRAVKRAMEQSGFSTPLVHTGPTFDHLGLQLDWVYTRDMNAFDTRIEPLRFSDHHAVAVRVVPKAAEVGDLRPTANRPAGYHPAPQASAQSVP